MQQVAVIIDWDNIKRRIFDKKRFPQELSYKQNDLRCFLCFFLKFLDKNEDLYRIFFYTAKPYNKDLEEHFKDLEKHFSREDLEEIKKSIIERSKNISNIINNFLHNLSVQNYIALRLGSLSFDGWDFTTNPPRPKFKQKKVDMLIGLDIAHLAYKKLVKRILLFSYDTDIQPALKVARIEGLQIILPVLEDDFIEKPPAELIKHTDILRKRKVEDIKNACLNKNLNEMTRK